MNFALLSLLSPSILGTRDAHAVATRDHEYRDLLEETSLKTPFASDDSQVLEGRATENSDDSSVGTERESSVEVRGEIPRPFILNMDKIRSISRLGSVHSHGLGVNQALQILNGLHQSVDEKVTKMNHDEKFVDISRADALKEGCDYIKRLYEDNNSRQVLFGHGNYQECVNETMSLVEGILEGLRKELEEENSRAKGHLNLFFAVIASEGDPSWKKARLEEIYWDTHPKSSYDSIESFVKDRIFKLKDDCLGAAVTAHIGVGGLRSKKVLDCWKYDYRRGLGLPDAYRPLSHGQQIRSRDGASEADLPPGFSEWFNPELVVKELTHSINQEPTGDLIRKSEDFFANVGKEVDEKTRKEYIGSKFDEDAGGIRRIKKSSVRYMLLRMGFLSCRKPPVPTPHSTLRSVTLSLIHGIGQLIRFCLHNSAVVVTQPY